MDISFFEYPLFFASILFKLNNLFLFIWLHQVLVVVPSCSEACGIFVPRLGIEPKYPTLQGRIHNH